MNVSPGSPPRESDSGSTSLEVLPSIWHRWFAVLRFRPHFRHSFRLSFDDVVSDAIMDTGQPPSKRLEDLIHLAELCVDLLQQNNEHYAEVMRKASGAAEALSF